MLLVLPELRVAQRHLPCHTPHADIRNRAGGFALMSEPEKSSAEGNTHTAKSGRLEQPSASRINSPSTMRTSF
jgi:hypothetical protein